MIGICSLFLMPMFIKNMHLKTKLRKHEKETKIKKVKNIDFPLLSFQAENENENQCESIRTYAQHTPFTNATCSMNLAKLNETYFVDEQW